MLVRSRAQRLLSSFDVSMETLFAPQIVKYWSEVGIRPCATYCLLAAPMLRIGLAQPDLRVVIGTHEVEETDTINNHCWIEHPDGTWILDPTFKQFDPTSSINWAVFYAGVRPDRRFFSRYYPKKILSLDEEDHYRRTITPAGRSDIKEDFWSTTPKESRL